MATALAKGLLDRQVVTPERICASDPSPEARAHFAEMTGAAVTDDNRQLVEHANVVFLAIKPQHVPSVCGQLKGQLEWDHLLISIVAGLKLTSLDAALGPGPRLVRVMPNTPALVGQGASGYCLGTGTTKEDGALVASLLSCVGLALEVPEALLDAVTGLSGSGPAFVYLMIEALSDGGVLMGLPRDVSTRLAAQTLLGAAKLVLESGQHPGALKDQVASPGGTTIAGLAALERGGLRAALISAVQAATLRATELGNKTS